LEGTVTDQQNPDDPISNPLDPDGDDDSVEALFISPAHTRSDRSPDPYDLGWLFLCWSWEAGYRSWNDGLRALVRALRGLEKLGLIERRRIRRVGRHTHHGFVLTDEGRDAVAALSGEWIQPSERS